MGISMEHPSFGLAVVDEYLKIVFFKNPSSNEESSEKDASDLNVNNGINKKDGEAITSQNDNATATTTSSSSPLVLACGPIMDKLEFSMRSHLLTLTEALIQPRPRPQSPSRRCSASSSSGDGDVKNQHDKVSGELDELLQFLQACLHFCAYILKEPRSPCHDHSVAKQLPFLLLEDAFDTIPSRLVPSLWTGFVVQLQETMCSSPFFVQYSMLVFIKLCNKLHKRFSANVEFTGRIHMLLAAVFPLSERSACNVTGKFNVEKEVEFETKEEWLDQQQQQQQQKLHQQQQQQQQQQQKKQSEGKENNNDATKTPIKNAMVPSLLEYQFYDQFWGTQKYFSDPNCIIGKWSEFETNVNAILSAFENNMLDAKNYNATINTTTHSSKRTDDTSSSKNTNSKMEVDDVVTTDDKMDIDETQEAGAAAAVATRGGVKTMIKNHHHQYLTSSQLFTLQLRDPELRVHFLTQLMIVCSHILYSSQTAAAAATTTTTTASETTENFPTKALHTIQERAENLLRNTPPNGTCHLKCLKWTLTAREPLWRHWKKEKCPKLDKFLVKPTAPVTETETETKTKTESETETAIPKEEDESDGEEVEQLQPTDDPYSSTITDDELKRISRGIAEKYRPSYEILEDFADALDPESGIEEEYHPRNDTVKHFRALRCLRDTPCLLTTLAKVRKRDGDLEGVVREVWRKEKGEELPGVVEDTEEDFSEIDEQPPDEEAPTPNSNDGTNNSDDKAAKQTSSEMNDHADDDDPVSVGSPEDVVDPDKETTNKDDSISLKKRFELSLKEEEEEFIDEEGTDLDTKEGEEPVPVPNEANNESETPNDKKKPMKKIAFEKKHMATDSTMHDNDPRKRLKLETTSKGDKTKNDDTKTVETTNATTEGASNKGTPKQTLETKKIDLSSKTKPQYKGADLGDEKTLQVEQTESDKKTPSSFQQIRTTTTTAPTTTKEKIAQAKRRTLSDNNPDIIKSDPDSSKIHGVNSMNNVATTSNIVNNNNNSNKRSFKHRKRGRSESPDNHPQGDPTMGEQTDLNTRFRNAANGAMADKIAEKQKENMAVMKTGGIPPPPPLPHPPLPMPPPSQPPMIPTSMANAKIATNTNVKTSSGGGGGGGRGIGNAPSIVTSNHHIGGSGSPANEYDGEGRSNNNTLERDDRANNFHKRHNSTNRDRDNHSNNRDSRRRDGRHDNYNQRRHNNRRRNDSGRSNDGRNDDNRGRYNVNKHRRPTRD